ncbi:hypothetical protein AXG93_1027s1010 [Marchantia polymorpha subsp. ruderalis]|uniref:Uncharacterized protein n=1 Tax=Marchantia polymorpha subsp. ruderalis TaxID=1480154 RepID=A0A176W1M1_MARPO|nr:hypothetical protein AXG93_1027s1010 [Marchantia polymorpha subsp. ruderalis]
MSAREMEALGRGHGEARGFGVPGPGRSGFRAFPLGTQATDGTVLLYKADARRQSQRERESVRESVPSAVTVAASHAFCPAHPEPPSVAPTAKGWPRRHGSSGSPSRVPSRPFPDRSVDACYTEANRSRSVLQPASSGFGGFASPSPASRSSARKAEERGAKGEGQGREAQQEGGVAPGSSFVFVWNFDH